MRVRWPALTIIMVAGIGYLASPYVALYRLGMAVRGADAATLQAMVDWYSVREGIKEDVSDQGTEAKGGALPPFGASFMRGIAASSIDRAVTPQAVLAAVTTAPVTSAAAMTAPAMSSSATSAPPPSASTPPASTPPERPATANVHVGWAFFDGISSFIVDLHARGEKDPIKLRLTFRGWAWHVHRVWLPDDMLSPGGTPS